MTRPFETLLPPPPEKLGKAYFSPILAPLPVVTRIPPPPQRDDLLKQPFFRLEAGGGGVMASGILYDIHIILHSYAPYGQETAAEDNMDNALAWGTNSQGTFITVNNIEWYITYSRATGMVTRHNDPLTKITRYRSMVGWRIQGYPLTSLMGVSYVP